MSARAPSLVLALDLGSSSVRTALFTENGQRLLPSSASWKYALQYRPDGAAELPAPLLLQATKRCLNKTLRWRRDSTIWRKIPIVAVGGSAFWHGLLALGRRSQPLSPIFTWADSRSAADARALRAKLSERAIQLRTGCMLRSPFWPAKLRWLRRTQPALWKQTATWASPADWIYHELFGSTATSHSMASGTGLYDLAAATWDLELCKICHLDLNQLAQLDDKASPEKMWHADLSGARIFTAIGDGAAGNLGSGVDDAGQIAINLGTSAAARSICSKRRALKTLPPGLFRYVVDRERVVIGGATSNSGNLRRWFLRELQLPEDRAEHALSRAAAATDTLCVLPFWVSERAPSWPEEVRGTITGLTPATTAAEIFRAATVSSYYRLAEIVRALDPRCASAIIVSGGVSHSPSSLRILADCLGRDLRVCREPESSLRGAAVRASTALGFVVKSLRPGRLVRQNSALAALHRSRRLRQSELERRLR